jgi:prepilin-type N-terminal cleavage/methylation domain-containing protein
MTLSRRQLPAAARARAGFTLIEAAIVTAIVGIAIVAMLQLMTAGSMANADSAESTTAVNLANNINEMLQGVNYTVLKSTYDNQTYSPAIDATGAALTSFSGWAQQVSIKYVDHNLVTSVVPDTQIEPTCRVTVTVFHNGTPVYAASWLIVQSS